MPLFAQVGYDLDEPTLEAHFSVFGEVQDVYLPKHPSGRNKVQINRVRTNDSAWRLPSFLASAANGSGHIYGACYPRFQAKSACVCPPCLA